MNSKIFSHEKIREMIQFCSKGYDAWGKVIRMDTAAGFVAGRDRSSVGRAYWDSFNNEISCILGVHTFLEKYLSSPSFEADFKQLDQVKSNFRLSAVNYKRQCSTEHLKKELDAEIAKNDARKNGRIQDLKVSSTCLASSVNDVASKINGILAAFGVLKSMKNNLASLDAPWDETYRAIRRDFLALASNIFGIFAPTSVGNSIIVAWMYSDYQDYKQFEKDGHRLSEDKKKLLGAADKFSGDTKIGDFYTYVLVTALAEHYGFSPNNGIKLNLKHEHLNMAKGILS